MYHMFARNGIAAYIARYIVFTHACSENACNKRTAYACKDRSKLMSTRLTTHTIQLHAHLDAWVDEPFVPVYVLLFILYTCATRHQAFTQYCVGQRA